MLLFADVDLKYSKKYLTDQSIIARFRNTARITTVKATAGKQMWRACFGQSRVALKHQFY
jgi:hypothetical protein